MSQSTDSEGSQLGTLAQNQEAFVAAEPVDAVVNEQQDAPCDVVSAETVAATEAGANSVGESLAGAGDVAQSESHVSIEESTKQGAEAEEIADSIMLANVESVTQEQDNRITETPQIDSSSDIALASTTYQESHDLSTTASVAHSSTLTNNVDNSCADGPQESAPSDSVVIAESTEDVSSPPESIEYGEDSQELRIDSGLEGIPDGPTALLAESISRESEAASRELESINAQGDADTMYVHACFAASARDLVFAMTWKHGFRPDLLVIIL
jgi:hypothetical protein